MLTIMGGNWQERKDSDFIIDTEEGVLIGVEGRDSARCSQQILTIRLGLPGWTFPILQLITLKKYDPKKCFFFDAMERINGIYIHVNKHIHLRWE